MSLAQRARLYHYSVNPTPNRLYTCILFQREQLLQPMGRGYEKPRFSCGFSRTPPFGKFSNEILGPVSMVTLELSRLTYDPSGSRRSTLSHYGIHFSIRRLHQKKFHSQCNIFTLHTIHKQYIGPGVFRLVTFSFPTDVLLCAELLI